MNGGGIVLIVYALGIRNRLGKDTPLKTKRGMRRLSVQNRSQTVQEAAPWAEYSLWHFYLRET